MIYLQTFQTPKQALLVHRPRMASLRPRTRLDRQRSLESDVVDRELLTQVSQQVRNEFRPIYLQKQEIGMDLTEIVLYLQTFYLSAPAEFAKLNIEGPRAKDMPFNGNLTIAVGDKPGEVEKSKGGVEVLPLLDLWANSFKIEAGFGRYLKNDYVPQTDGEAKDL
jgi:hypothetical protein